MTEGHPVNASAGYRLRARAQGPKNKKVRASLEQIDPDIATWVDEFAFGEVWDRPGLSFEERMIVAISLLAGQGNGPQLRTYLFGAVHAGIEDARIRECLIMCSVYVGFPACIAALAVWKEVKDSIERAEGAGAPG